MTSFTGSALNGNKTDVEGFFKPLAQLFTPGVVTTTNSTALKVTQRGSGANMSVDVAAGIAILQRPDGSYSYQSWTDAATNVTVTSANPTNPRIDTIVAWVDPTVQSTASVNAPGSFKFMNVAGTPSGSPAAVSDSTIQSAVGSGNAWVKLATVTVGAGVTTIVNANIADVRSAVTARTTSASVADLAVVTAKLADDAVTVSKIDFATFVQAQGASGSNVSFSDGGYNDLSTPASVTVTVPASGKVKLEMSARVYGSTNDNSTFVTYVLSGTNTVAANDNNAIVAKVPGATVDVSVSRTKLFTGLTAGSTTFKLQRRNTAGSVTITYADLVITPIFD